MISRAVLLGTALLAGVGRAQAQTPGPGIEVPRAEGRATFTEEMSLRDIRAKALSQALHTAVGEALGRRLTAMTQVTTYEDSAGVSETFAEIVREAAQGIVTSHAILEEAWERGEPFTPGALYRVVVRATVRRMNGGRLLPSEWNKRFIGVSFLMSAAADGAMPETMWMLRTRSG